MSAVWGAGRSVPHKSVGQGCGQLPVHCGDRLPPSSLVWLPTDGVGSLSQGPLPQVAPSGHWERASERPGEDAPNSWPWAWRQWSYPPAFYKPRVGPAAVLGINNPLQELTAWRQCGEGRQRKARCRNVSPKCFPALSPKWWMKKDPGMRQTPEGTGGN